MKEKLLAIGGLFVVEATVVILIAAGVTLHDIMIILATRQAEKKKLKKAKQAKAAA